MSKALTPEQKKARALQKDELAIQPEVAAVSPQEVKPEFKTYTREEVIAKRAGRRRNTFNGTDQKLKLNNNPPENEHWRIFNDTPGRIDEALAVGYEFLTPEEVGGVTSNVVSRNTDIGDKVRFLVGKTEAGEPLYGYAMKILKEWFETDQAELAARNDKIDAAIRSGKGHKSDTTGFYVPDQGKGIKMVT